MATLESAYEELVSATGPTAFIVSITGEIKKLTQVLKNATILSGSFNPIHHGHVELIKSANMLAKNERVLLELSLVNADKGKVALEDLQKRVKWIHDEKFDVLLTNLPKFIDKILIFSKYFCGVINYSQVLLSCWL